MLIHVTSADFQEKVLNADKPVLVDFWASWCGPCRMLGPVLEKIGESSKGFDVAKINVDEEQALAAQYQIMSIPTVLLFQGGKVVAQSVGAVPEQTLRDLVRTHTGITE
ncbi:MAG TPA: thioredoxin [Candidatus Ruthenibacterium merdavium]|uniref:Thioredoxin n=1 Tax=Candidatus Ruthenibacterium merdavium TaxID=2838752 RepID=A0A9D2Q4Z4_9FIRM|nr:thioredoxin [Candidatus Ruthenibacterium merdavium]